VFLANFAGQSVTDLTVRIGPGPISRGLQVGSGALVERVRVDTGPGADPGRGLDAFGATVRQVEVRLPREPFVTAATVAGTIEDSTFEGGTGIFLGGGVARRIVAIGNQAMIVRSSLVEDSTLRALGPGARGVELGTREGGAVRLSHVSVVGDGSADSIGLKAEKGMGAFAALTSTLTVRNTVVSGFARDLTHHGYAGSGTTGCGTDCQITQTTDVAYSALDFPERVADLGGPGSLTLGPGNVDLGDPRFADGVAGELRPRFDSPLIDAGDPAPLGTGVFYSGESPVDLGGLERIVDGLPGGDPAARRDIGAHEYARRSPSLTVGTPSAALLYRPVTIPVSASDPDPFDALTFRFAFDGRDAGASATHVFTTLGKHAARVTVSDPTGAATTGETSFSVTALRGRCANRRSGGSTRDNFKGTPAGDDLRGGRGRDALRGAAGADCLSGGAGNDLTDGGSGADRVNGGKGRDRIKGGKGRDRISARDGQRDRVDCGPGRDRAVADRKDRLRRCEVVTRR
jgi:hypothetical protein